MPMKGLYSNSSGGSGKKVDDPTTEMGTMAVDNSSWPGEDTTGAVTAKRGIAWSASLSGHSGWSIAIASG